MLRREEDVRFPPRTASNFRPGCSCRNAGLPPSGHHHGPWLRRHQYHGLEPTAEAFAEADFRGVPVTIGVLAIAAANQDRVASCHRLVQAHL